MSVAGVLGTGSALPEKVITNADLEKLVETSDQWITERTGIRERRQACSPRDDLHPFGASLSPRSGEGGD